jgi:hypothetical protein
MFLGHYAVAFAAKRAAPRVSLGTFAFAVQFLDELWPFLLLAGIEHARLVPGRMAASHLEFTSYPISHSLLAAAVWGIGIGALYFAVRRERRAAIVVGLCVVSHWFLDVPMHLSDLPLWPGSSTFIGAGFWRSLPLTLAIDLGLLAVGLTIYLRSTRALDRIGRWGLWFIVALLLVVFFASVLLVPPAPPRALGITVLGLWVYIPLMAWVDRHRAVITQPSARAIRAMRSSSDVASSTGVAPLTSMPSSSATHDTQP